MSFPLILFLVLFGIIIIPFSVLVVIVILKGRNQTWKGTIVDKLENTHTDMDDHTTTNLVVVVQIDGGREAKVAVDAGRYNAWNVGDRLQKVKKESWPKKIS